MKPCGLLVVTSTILRHEDIRVNIRSIIPFSLKSWAVIRGKQLIEQGDDFKPYFLEVLPIIPIFSK